MLRGTVSLPAGTGKDVRVAVFVGDLGAPDACPALAEMVGELFPERGAKT